MPAFRDPQGCSRVPGIPWSRANRNNYQYAEMKVANPIYDVVFKYLMKDNRVAKLVISHIIEQEIESLDFGVTELNRKKSDGSLTVLRLDFTARIKQPDGSSKLVLIELQKAKFPTDITRFRKYLGKQYQEENNIYIDEQTGQKKGLPIISIYILGHNLQYNDSPVIHVKRDYYDQATKEKLTEREEFIESLTHDSYIIQVQRLRKKHRNKLETLLSIFDQRNTSKESKHFLDLFEASYPYEFRVIIRRLEKASASKELCDDMELEDDFLEELKTQERVIALERAAKERERKEKEQALAEKEEERIEKERALAAEKKALAAEKQALTEQERLKALLEKAGIDYRSS
jgi:hypothetical protein